MTSINSRISYMTKLSKNNCITCSSTLIESKQYRASNCQSFQIDFHHGLHCVICYSYICLNCIIDFHLKILPLSSKSMFHPDMNPFLRPLHQHASKFLECIHDDGDIPAPQNSSNDNFIGHCCILKPSSIIQQQKKTNIVMESTKDTYIVRSSKKMKFDQKSTELLDTHDTILDPPSINPIIRLGGSFIFEQCKVIVPTSFSYVDCMALAKEPNLPAITHFVLDEIYASTLRFTGSIIAKSLPCDWKIDLKLKSVTIPYLRMNRGGRQSVSCISFSCFYYDYYFYSYIHLSVSIHHC